MESSPLSPGRFAFLIALSATSFAACDGDSPTGTDQGPAAEVVADRLLTDAELASPPAGIAIDLPTAWSEWIVANHHPVRSITHDGDFSDLEFLRGYLEGRRIVQLGESGHGVRQFNQAKVRLVKYLHQELGYDVIAFESGFFECYQADRTVAVIPPRLVLERCVFQVWQTEEVVELFEYIRRTRHTSRPLRLVGFDSQISSLWTISERDDYLRRIVEAFNPSFAAPAETLEREFLTSYRFKQPVDRFAGPFDALLDSVETHRSAIEQAFPTDPLRWPVVRQSVWSTTRFIDQLSSTPNVGTAIRDSTMADNFEFVADVVYPDRKIMIWAHNYHIMNAAGTMGEWLRERFGDELYTLGLYMHEGSATNNARRPYQIPVPQSPGLEGLMNRAGRRYMFVDLASQPEEPGTAWMDQRIMTRSWGVTPDPLVPREQYDGLFWVHTVTAPEYLP